jgi:hypothetical protein
MTQAVLKIRRRIPALLALVIIFAAQAIAQSFTEAQRIAELSKVRNGLKSDTFRNADVIFVVSERAIAESVKQFVGLEITLANGNVMKLNSIESQLVTGAVLIKIGVQSKSTNLQLSGRLSSGEIQDTPEGRKLKMPLQVTEVKLINGGISSLLIKTLFGAWLKPETWNDELPSLTLPLEINEAMEIPAAQFKVEGQMPMEIVTAAYRAPLKLSLTSLLVLEKRAVITLQVSSSAPTVPNIPIEPTVDDRIGLENEIAQLSANLVPGAIGDSDVRLRLSRNVISSLLSQIAAQQNPDLKFKLKQGRVRSNEVKTVVSIVNYTDIENGDGQADVSELRVESIADGKVNVRLSGQGVIDAKIKGREYGIPYGFSPRTNFAINNQPIPLQFNSENGRVMLQAVPGTALPINLRFTVNVAGHEVGVNRTEAVLVDRWLNRIELPALLNREILLPNKLEIDAGGNLHVTNKRKLDYALSNLRFGASNDVVDITADVKVNPR